MDPSRAIQHEISSLKGAVRAGSGHSVISGGVHTLRAAFGVCSSEAAWLEEGRAGSSAELEAQETPGSCLARAAPREGVHLTGARGAGRGVQWLRHSAALQ